MKGIFGYSSFDQVENECIRCRLDDDPCVTMVFKYRDGWQKSFSVVEFLNELQNCRK
jgi:hypothetical protein